MSHIQKHLHAKKKKDTFDYLLYFFTVGTPMFELPQAYAIYSTQSAANVSLWTWGFFMTADIMWLVYAARNKLRPLLVMYSLFFIVESSIVVGILLYS